MLWLRDEPAVGGVGPEQEEEESRWLNGKPTSLDDRKDDRETATAAGTPLRRLILVGVVFACGMSFGLGFHTFSSSPQVVAPVHSSLDAVDDQTKHGDGDDSDLLYAPDDNAQEAEDELKQNLGGSLSIDEDRREDTLENVVEELADEAQDISDLSNRTNVDSVSDSSSSSIVDEINENNVGKSLSSVENGRITSFWDTVVANVFPSSNKIMKDLPKVLSKYIEWHRNQIANPQKSTKYLIYTCIESCGGLGNRMMGILSMLAVAVETDRVFGIDWTHPFPLSDTLNPALLDWMTPVKLAKHKDKAVHSFIRGGSLMHEVQIARKVLAFRAIENKITLVDVIRRGKKLNAASFPRKFMGPGGVLHIPRFATMLFKMLFRPSPELQQFILDNSAELGLDLSQSYVAVHMRMGNVPDNERPHEVAKQAVQTRKRPSVRVRHEKFVDSSSRHHIKDVPKFVSCAKTMAANLMGREAGSSKPLPQVFLASDSVEAKLHFTLNGYTGLRSAAQNMSRSVFFNEVAIHITRNSGKFKAQFFEKAKRANMIMWAELLLLAGAKCSVVSRSSFSYIAMVLGADMKETSPHCEARFDHCGLEALKDRMQDNPRIAWEVEQGINYHYWRGQLDEEEEEQP